MRRSEGRGDGDIGRPRCEGKKGAKIAKERMKRGTKI